MLANFVQIHFPGRVPIIRAREGRGMGSVAAGRSLFIVPGKLGGELHAERGRHGPSLVDFVFVVVKITNCQVSFGNSDASRRLIKMR